MRMGWEVEVPEWSGVSLGVGSFLRIYKLI